LKTEPARVRDVSGYAAAVRGLIAMAIGGGAAWISGQLSFLITGGGRVRSVIGFWAGWPPLCSELRYPQTIGGRVRESVAGGSKTQKNSLRGCFSRMCGEAAGNSSSGKRRSRIPSENRAGMTFATAGL